MVECETIYLKPLTESGVKHPGRETFRFISKGLIQDSRQGQRKSVAAGRSSGEPPERSWPASAASPTGSFELESISECRSKQ